jgi:hypothetical protein
MYTYVATGVPNVALAFGGAWKIQEVQFAAREKDRVE